MKTSKLKWRPTRIPFFSLKIQKRSESIILTSGHSFSRTIKKITKIIWWPHFTFQCPFGAELSGGSNFCVRVRKLPEGWKGVNFMLSNWFLKKSFSSPKRLWGSIWITRPQQGLRAFHQVWEGDTQSVPVQFWQMSLFRNLTYGDVCASVQEQSSDGAGPTHIVASITYGMNAIMIFEKVTWKM